ncbi:MAG: helix-turn-helix transcriptional regulator, partial [Bacteroidetes bacterium]|nr:helix-turn-helix transcriptional regulator [Bacteroidota bacterium]
LEIRIGNLIEQRKRLRERFTSATIIRPNEVSAVSIDQEFLKKVLDCIEENLTNEQFGLEMLAEEVGMSVSNLNRKLSALVDQTAGKLIRSMRLQRAADLLKQNAASISEIAYDMGFNSHTAFTRSFKQQFGVSPTEYVNG